MLTHPLIDALFDINSCEPSKQLISVRQRLSVATKEPLIMLILPPADSIYTEIGCELLLKDTFLLSHVLDLTDTQGSLVKTLNGSNWTLEVGKNELSPGAGFPIQMGSVAITNRYLWSPGLDVLPFDAQIMVLEVDRLIISGDTAKRSGWFNKSAPKPEFARNMLARRDEILQSNVTAVKIDQPKNVNSKVERAVSNHTFQLYSHKPENPAKHLGKNASEREQNMAKVDYCLACLQGDVVSSSELADRFHRAVKNAIQTVEQAGGKLIPEDMAGDEEHIVLAPGSNRFTTASIYRYAEYRLSKLLLGKLDQLLEVEREGLSFVQMHRHLRHLDIGQVDIPGLENFDDINVLEQAVADAALVLGRLSQARNAYDMCKVFLNSLETLADPKLGTVSADTLLSLFILTVLRASDDCASVLERDLYFVLHFSFQTSNSSTARASAGRLSYTLMVVESVILQLRMEYPRLLKLANSNKAVWEAVRSDQRPELHRLAEASPSSLVSRRGGKSVLFMVIEDENADLLRFLLDSFSSLFTADFILKDRDMFRHTLLMVAARQKAQLGKLLLEVLSESLPQSSSNSQLNLYFTATDLLQRGLAFYVADPNFFGEEFVPLFDFTTKDTNGITPIMYHASRGNLAPFIHHVVNFFDHIDPLENSLLHMASDEPELLRQLTLLPSCDTNWANRTGRAPIQKAQRNQECVDILLSSGADIWLPFFLDDVETIQRKIHSVRDYPFAVRVSKDSQDFTVHALNENNDVVISRHTYDCFAKLRTSLMKENPTFWVPSLPPIKKAYSEEAFSMFAHQLISQESVEVSIWFSILQAAFKDSKTFKNFFTSANYEENSDEGENKVENFVRPADKVSVIAFFDLAQEYLRTVSVSMSDTIRHMARLESRQLNDTYRTTQVERQLANKLAPCYDLRFSIRRCELTVHLQGSQQLRVLRTSFGQLIHAAQDFESRLQDPRRLAEELERAKAQYTEHHERLAELAKHRSKPLWLTSSENKRVAEIRALEERVTAGKARINELENLISATHLSLATELSAFKVMHEKEVLDQIKHYSQGQLQAAKDGLKRLDFGYKLSSIS